MYTYYQSRCKLPSTFSSLEVLYSLLDNSEVVISLLTCVHYLYVMHKRSKIILEE